MSVATFNALLVLLQVQSNSVFTVDTKTHWMVQLFIIKSEYTDVSLRRLSVSQYIKHWQPLNMVWIWFSDGRHLVSISVPKVSCTQIFDGNQWKVSNCCCRMLLFYGYMHECVYILASHIVGSPIFIINRKRCQYYDFVYFTFTILLLLTSHFTLNIST